MLLFRRSLLCLVVGVTAFGVAGWGFRPRASWTVELGKIDGLLSFGNRASESIEGTRVWIQYSQGSEVGVWPETVFAECRSLDSGRLLFRSVADGWNDMMERRDGSLAFVRSIDGEKETEFGTAVEFIDPESFKSRTVKLRGSWDLSTDGFSVFKLDERPEGLTFSLADSSSGIVKTTRTFEGCKPNFRGGDFAVSADGSRFAVCERSCDSRQPPFGVTLFNVQNLDAPVRVIPPDSKIEQEGCAIDAMFRLEEGQLHFTWIRNPVDSIGERWQYDLATGRCERYPALLGPAMPQDSFFMNPLHSKDEAGLFFAASRSQPEYWYCVERGGKSIVPWRKLPMHFIQGGAYPFDARPFLIQRVPERDQFVCKGLEAPWSSSLPESVHAWGPAILSARQTVKHRWHDWNRNEWRYVGDLDDAEKYQTRQNRVLSLTRGDGYSCILQSWPLPPRDPKWPALGVAALCAAGTWWACAKRYRRRMNRAAVPSAAV